MRLDFERWMFLPQCLLTKELDTSYIVIPHNAMPSIVQTPYNDHSLIYYYYYYYYYNNYHNYY